MKSFICMIAAGLFLLPAWGVSAEKKEIHTVMTAEEGSPAAQAPAQETATHAEAEEAALDEEMDELGEEAAGSHDAATPPPAQRHAALGACMIGKAPHAIMPFARSSFSAISAVCIPCAAPLIMTEGS